MWCLEILKGGKYKKLKQSKAALYLHKPISKDWYACIYGSQEIYNSENNEWASKFEQLMTIASFHACYGDLQQPKVGGKLLVA